MAMLRLASSRVGRFAVRAIASPRILSELITNAFRGRGTDQHSLVKRERERERERESTPNCDHEKNLVDRYLVKVLKSEIKSKQLYMEKIIPADFPFTIHDDGYPYVRLGTVDPTGPDYITLTREFDGEKIDVVVRMPYFIPKDDEEEIVLSGNNNINDAHNGGAVDSSSTDSDSDEEKEKSGAHPAPSVSLSVGISKENGKKLTLDVSASADEIKIKSVLVEEPKKPKSTDDDYDDWCPPAIYMVDKDGHLQLALREYLKIRGINKTTAGFLYKCMVRKFKQQPMLVLEYLKKFIKE